jgi:hypothetical protein
MKIEAMFTHAPAVYIDVFTLQHVNKRENMLLQDMEFFRSHTRIVKSSEGLFLEDHERKQIPQQMQFSRWACSHGTGANTSESA